MNEVLEHLVQKLNDLSIANKNMMKKMKEVNLSTIGVLLESKIIKLEVQKLKSKKYAQNDKGRGDELLFVGSRTVLTPCT